MIINVIGDVGIIREVGIIEDGSLSIEINGIPDGTQLTLTGVSGRYSIKSLKENKADFEASEPGEYTLSFYNASEDIIHIYFKLFDNGIIRKIESAESELSKLWRAVAILADLLEKNTNKIVAITDGYQTE
ncbi:MAG: hypothetical protein IJE25_08335 [Clostridia bacterium]|nr:hypothetical protein [Clostridia bacterium]